MQQVYAALDGYGHQYIRRECSVCKDETLHKDSRCIHCGTCVVRAKKTVAERGLTYKQQRLRAARYKRLQSQANSDRRAAARRSAEESRAKFESK